MNIVRIQYVTNVTGLSRTTVWRLERRGDFPRRLRLGQNSCGWVAQEIEDWIASRPRGMTSGEHGVAAQPGPKAEPPTMETTESATGRGEAKNDDSGLTPS